MWRLLHAFAKWQCHLASIATCNSVIYSLTVVSLSSVLAPLETVDFTAFLLQVWDKPIRPFTLPKRPPVSVLTFRTWVSTSDQKLAELIPKWLSHVEQLCWKDTSSMFSNDWADQWHCGNEESVLHLLEHYKAFIQPEKKVFKNEFHQGTSSSGWRSMAKWNERIEALHDESDCADQNDENKARKHKEQEEFVQQLVINWWNVGNPITKIEIQIEVSLREDCNEGTPFHESHLNLTSRKAQAGWVNWLGRALDRAEKNSNIG